MSKETGGPAFPTQEFVDGLGHSYDYGMTLRDYAAIHTEQPGMAEICSEAGVYYLNGAVWSDEATNLGTFDKWWMGLPQEKRFELNAVVRYKIADAMLAERAK